MRMDCPGQHVGICRLPILTEIAKALKIPKRDEMFLCVAVVITIIEGSHLPADALKIETIFFGKLA